MYELKLVDDCGAIENGVRCEPIEAGAVYV
jgi:hypothetical protein